MGHTTIFFSLFPFVLVCSANWTEHTHTHIHHTTHTDRKLNSEQRYGLW